MLCGSTPNPSPLVPVLMLLLFGCICVSRRTSSARLTSQGRVCVCRPAHWDHWRHCCHSWTQVRKHCAMQACTNQQVLVSRTSHLASSGYNLGSSEAVWCWGPSGTMVVCCSSWPMRHGCSCQPSRTHVRETNDRGIWQHQVAHEGGSIVCARLCCGVLVLLLQML